MNAIQFISLIILTVLGFTPFSNLSVSRDNCTRVAYTVLPKPGKAIIVDVPASGEWNNDGQAVCTVNYPLDELSKKIAMLKAYEKEKGVCRSGNRGNAAK